MQVWKENDRSEGMCSTCKRRVETVFKLRDYRLGESGIEVPKLLVAVCRSCDGIVAIPAQSTPKLKEARERRKEEFLEVRIPSHLDDVIHLLAERFAAAVTAFRPDLLRFYLGEVVSGEGFAARVGLLADTDLAKGPACSRITLRVPEDMLSAARNRARAAGISTDAALVRGLIVAAKEDVLDGRTPGRAESLRGVAQAEGAMPVTLMV